MTLKNRKALLYFIAFLLLFLASCITSHAMTVNWSYQNLVSLNYFGGDGRTESLAGWTIDLAQENIYIYLQNVVPWIGERGTGNFAIITDVGNQYIININQSFEGIVTGEKGEPLDATIQQYIREDGAPDCDIEIRIPIADLPTYNENIDFGLYMEEPVLYDLVLPHEEINFSNGFNIDGDYSDWDYFYKTQLDYTTNGGQDNTIDGVASIFSDGEYIYGYCMTEDESHTQNALDASYVTLFDGIDYSWDSRNLTFLLAIVDEDGSIHQVDLSSITSGTTKLGIFDLTGWGVDGQNINNLQGQEFYGWLYVTVDRGNKVEVEYYVDQAKFTQRYGTDYLSTISAYYVRIGGTVTAGGTPTGYLILVPICISITLLGAIIQKKQYA